MNQLNCHFPGSNPAVGSKQVGNGMLMHPPCLTPVLVELRMQNATPTGIEGDI